jgi:hypothetical protein
MFPKYARVQNPKAFIKFPLLCIIGFLNLKIAILENYFNSKIGLSMGPKT